MSIDLQSPCTHLETPPFPVHRFTVDEYHRLAETGVLTEQDRVELLEGWIVPKMVHNPLHSGVLEMADAAIRSRLSADWKMCIQLPVSAADSEPEPDLAVVEGPPDGHLARHPEPHEIGLVVEVADPSLAYDRQKCRIYARAGIPVYWIINLIDSQIEAYSEPTGDVPVPAYRRQQVYGMGDLIPLVIGGTELEPIPARQMLVTPIGPGGAAVNSQGR